MSIKPRASCVILFFMLQIFGVLSGLLPVLGIIPYIRDIARRKTKPHRGSFAIWTVLGAIAFFTQLAKGATWSLFLPAADTVAVALIFLFSIKRGVGGLTKTDRSGLVFAAMGLIAWYFTQQPMTALLITIGIDAVGSILTVIKTYAEPHSETFFSWLLASMGGLAAAFAVHPTSFSLLLYPVYILMANGVVAAIILLRRSKNPASTLDLI